VTDGNIYNFKVAPAWLITSYAIASLGELMISPMGLSLVSKVAPLKRRGLMMGGWFVATAFGNLFTVIGIYWERWLHSLTMALILFLLLNPLKKAMPGI
jgi:POT family proton-dependent oligopeptide transporter